MGVTDEFNRARELISRELRFDLGGEASEFRLALDRAGYKRFEHCVTLTRMWARPWHKGQAKYDHLMALLRLVTPEKVGPLRNKQAEAAKQINAQLDAELADILRREP